MAKKKQDVPDETRLETDEDLEDIVDSVIGTEDKDNSTANSEIAEPSIDCLLYTSPSPRDRG